MFYYCSYNFKFKFDKDCELLNKQHATCKGVKALCSKFGSSLENAADERHKVKCKNYCSYLRYWLYDKIGKINKVDRTNKLSAITFAKDLFTATLPFENNISLDDLIKRKILYIYFNKYTNIKSSINPQNKDECSNYFTYLIYTKSLYDKYNRVHCPFIWSFCYEHDFFRCARVHDPKDLLSNVQQCKPKETVSSSTSLWEVLFESSPSPTPAKGRDTGAQAPGKVVAARELAYVGSIKGKDVKPSPTTNKGLAAVEPPPRGAQISKLKRVEAGEISHNSQSNHMPLSGRDGRHSANYNRTCGIT
ncbi:VIR-like CYIR protein [Plasmodium cynomolgi strain B]|uniref:VIR-like CYIR protein n=1 Tax=Plasmodium cynomolgi (strain B) TaxID=1120755 RepID=K6UIV1_PLACD|nr:VIR-like CYIR protein [Plasmodium cynomolgi strain B]GAB65368.1 VIR-like CYIR protein [Plasmodium cynomolgi strain B]